MNKDFIKATGVRALRTLCQTLVATIGTKLITEVDWKYVVAVSATSALLSVLTSIITGLPEVEVSDDSKSDNNAG